MTKEETVNEILRLCEDENGFLVQLRVGETFNEQLYRQMVDAYSRYSVLVGKEENVNRLAVGYLFDFLFLLDTECSQLRKRHHPDSEKVCKAHDEVLGIVGDLFR